MLAFVAMPDRTAKTSAVIVVHEKISPTDFGNVSTAPSLHHRVCPRLPAADKADARLIGRNTHRSC
jgi:hypothetical protein